MHISPSNVVPGTTAAPQPSLQSTTPSYTFTSGLETTGADLAETFFRNNMKFVISYARR